MQYRKLIIILSLINGDLESFWNNSHILEKIYNNKSNQVFYYGKEIVDLSVVECASRIMTLVHGQSYYCSFNKINRFQQQYLQMFDELFDSKRKILAAFHRFFTVDQDEMVEMITSGPKSNSKFKLDEIRRNEFFDPLIFNYLNLDTESVSMLKALICTTLGDSEGFEYIGREYNLSIASSTACKAILSNKVKKMQELLFSLDKGSLYSKSIVRILHGDI